MLKTKLEIYLPFLLICLLLGIAVAGGIITLYDIQQKVIPDIAQVNLKVTAISYEHAWWHPDWKIYTFLLPNGTSFTSYQGCLPDYRIGQNATLRMLSGQVLDAICDDATIT